MMPAGCRGRHRDELGRGFHRLPRRSPPGAGAFDLDGVEQALADLNRSLVPERAERAFIASLHLAQRGAGLGTLLGLDRAFGEANFAGLRRYSASPDPRGLCLLGQPLRGGRLPRRRRHGRDRRLRHLLPTANGQIAEVKRHRGRESIGFFFGL